MNDFLLWFHECLRVNRLIIVALVELFVNWRRSMIAISIMDRVVEAVVLALVHVVLDLLHADLILVLLVHDRCVRLVGLDCALELLCTALVFTIYFGNVCCIGYSPPVRWLINIVIGGLFVAHRCGLRDRLIELITGLVHVQRVQVLLGRRHLRGSHTWVRRVHDQIFSAGGRLTFLLISRIYRPVHIV